MVPGCPARNPAGALCAAKSAPCGFVQQEREQNRFATHCIQYIKSCGDTYAVKQDYKTAEFSSTNFL
jgi:hypothetical protein